jgi:integrase
MLRVFEDQQRANDLDRRKAGDLWQQHDLVFPNPVGRPRDAAYRSISFHTALERAGLTRIRLHDLRHTAATYLMTNHVHPKVVQDLLGHSTIAITLDLYSHVMQPLAKDASGHMSNLVPVATPSDSSFR